MKNDKPPLLEPDPEFDPDLDPDEDPERKRRWSDSYFFQVPGGLAVQIIGAISTGIFLYPLREGGRLVGGLAICGTSIAVGIALVRNRRTRGYGWGVLIGAGLMALVSARCAMALSNK